MFLENHMYLFEGKDYSKEPSKEDRESFEQLVNIQKTLLEKTSQEGRLLRNKGSVRTVNLCEDKFFQSFNKNEQKVMLRMICKEIRMYLFVEKNYSLNVQKSVVCVHVYFWILLFCPMDLFGYPSPDKMS